MFYLHPVNNNSYYFITITQKLNIFHWCIELPQKEKPQPLHCPKHQCDEYGWLHCDKFDTLECTHTRASRN